MSNIKPLKILIINYEHPPLGGGGGVCTQRMSQALSKLGHKVDILTTKAPDLPAISKEGKVTVHRVPVLGRSERKTASKLSMFTFPFLSIPKGLLLCLKNKYDIINTHFYAPTGPTGLVISLLTRIPNVLYIHGADVYDPSRINITPAGKGLLSVLLRASAQIQNKFAEKIICQSTNTKENIEKYIKPDKPVEIIPLPFEKPKHPKASRKELGLEKDKFYILAAGRVVKRKGYQYLIQALPKLDPKIKVNVISGGPDIEDLHLLAKTLKVDDRINFIGEVPDYTDWYKYFVVSDMFVLPSLHEGLGIAFQEAMEFGLPIVTTNHGGQTDLIKDGHNGLLVDPKNVDQLVKAITKIFLSQHLQEKFRKNNIKDIKEYYSDRIAKKFLKLFQETLHKK